MNATISLEERTKEFIANLLANGRLKKFEELQEANYLYDEYRKICEEENKWKTWVKEKDKLISKA